MRKRTIQLSVSGLVAALSAAGITLAATASGASASPGYDPVYEGGGVLTGTGASMTAAASPSLRFVTTMSTYTPVTVASGALKPGDGYVLSGRVSLHGKADGLSTADCTYTTVKAPELRVCTIDYALGNGLIVTSGFIDSTNPGAAVTLVVAGGTGAFKDVRGYGSLVPTAAGSDVTLYLAK